MKVYQVYKEVHKENMLFPQSNATNEVDSLYAWTSSTKYLI